MKTTLFKKSQVIIIIALFITSCGTDESSESSDENTEILQEIEDENHLSTKPNYSMALDNYDELEECSEEIDKKLVYLMEEQIFLTCQSNEWVEIDLKPRDGIDGQNGSDGLDGQNSIAPSDTWEWLDSTQNLTFQVMGFFKHQDYTNEFTKICSGQYRLPTITEFETAIANGMIEYFNNLNFVFYEIPNEDDLYNLKYWLRDTINYKTTYYNKDSNNSIDYAENNQITISSGFGVCVGI
jgi:hypothetical protein